MPCCYWGLSKQGVDIIFDKTSQTDFNPKQQESDASQDKDATTTHVYIYVHTDNQWQSNSPIKLEGIYCMPYLQDNFNIAQIISTESLSYDMQWSKTDNCRIIRAHVFYHLKKISTSTHRMHQKQTVGYRDTVWTKQYVFSPDTDTYIDLTTIGWRDKNIEFERDPYLANIDEQRLMTNFSITLCKHRMWLQYFLCWNWKRQLSKSFFMLEGSLSDVNERNKEQGPCLPKEQLIFSYIRASYMGNK